MTHLARMDDSWVCGSCHSVNRPGTSRCYSCRQSRVTVEDPLVGGPVADEDLGLDLGGAVTMDCPACGTRRVGWSSHCPSCGLSFDDLALAEAMEAASEGPGTLDRLLVRRLPVLIPGLLVLVVALVVLLVAVTLDPSFLGKLQW